MVMGTQCHTTPKMITNTTILILILLTITMIRKYITTRRLPSGAVNM